ncbi:hypothetical protein BDN72DRAFT_957959 [Pluteus cervinus]|uniref:Uncharacterized protein n=1 Tax=Pluteus cervinus TaxID=181527 RepID=A0ACD3B3Y7_9AGAR|nr:hypothetical protein BDN72DRAFT_957959 [Pluteus cervinus]
MQFLPPEDAPKGIGAKNYLYTRVRLAWYYRPGDVSDRPVADSRLLLAAIYSEVCDINQLRAKCHVVHRDKISDLAGWKKRPDRFYFNRLFDPYIKKEFEIIQSTDVRNLPENIRETLISRYEYVVAEKEVIPDLTDAIRLCDTCDGWCPSPDTVQCEYCKRFFHMRCVQPPLSAKPARGYGWTCAPCSRQREEEVDGHEPRNGANASTSKPKSNAPAPRGRGRPRKDRNQAEKEEALPIKHFNLWPFRYFGQHTVAEDTLDSEDLIFPRTATRVGPKYQVNVPPAPDYGRTGPADGEERGGDSTVEVLGNFNSFTEAELVEVEAYKKGLTSDAEQARSVDWLTEVVRRFSDAASAAKPFTSVNMKSGTRMEKWKKHETRYTDREWTREEVAAFEDGISLHGAELRAVRDEVGTRSVPEVVRFYGQWKNEKLGEENQRIQRKGAPPKAPLRQYSSLAEANDGQHVGLSDDEESVVQPTKMPVCGACRTKESKTWWKAPKGLHSTLLCDVCGTNWRKYADLSVRPLREDSLPKNKPSEKREGTPLHGPTAKRVKTSASAQSTPPPQPLTSAPQIRCLACNNNGPLGKVVKCKQCGFRVHAGAGGVVVDPANIESWICELCQNLETQEASVNSECLLCPKENIDNKSTLHPPADNLLRACKPTEGQGWAHVVCAVFTPDLVFTDASRLRLVEKISLIPRRQWATRCVLCSEIQGAVIRCSDCSKEFHVSCAWKQGHKFGFEIQPVKSSRRELTTMISFNGETGCMNPIVSCKDHDHSRREIYDMCDTNDGGETALQVYCQAYKQAPSDAHGLLRKARRLDQILGVRNDASNPPPPPQDQPLTEPQCSKCQTVFSPAFYPIGSSTPGLLSQWHCHRCHFESKEKTNGVEITVS